MFPKHKKGQTDYKEEKGEDVGNDYEEYHGQRKMSSGDVAEGFLKSGISEAHMKPRAGVHNNPSSLTPTLRKVWFAHCLLIAGAL